MKKPVFAGLVIIHLLLKTNFALSTPLIYDVLLTGTFDTNDTSYTNSGTLIIDDLNNNNTVAWDGDPWDLQLNLDGWFCPETSSPQIIIDDSNNIVSFGYSFDWGSEWGIIEADYFSFTHWAPDSFGGVTSIEGCATFTLIPEPTTMLLFVTGLTILTGVSRRNKK